jgi:DNA-binding Xre family transcriptional regulator
MDIIDKICKALDCQPEDIVEYVKAAPEAGDK